MKPHALTFDEHPAGSLIFRMRILKNGRRVTLLSGVEAAEAPVETCPIGRVVYFMRRPPFLVKIGWTDDIRARVSALQSTLGEKLEVLATLPGGPGLEAFVHAAFRDYHHQGEWFHYTAGLKHFIFDLRQIARFRGEAAA